jgi:hypothetical protein
MVSRNLPILYLNVLSFMPSDFAREVFLWATEQPWNDRMCYRAEAFAEEAHRLREGMAPMLKMAAKIHGLDDIPPGLMDFFLTRHANWRIGGNVRPPYAARETR